MGTMKTAELAALQCLAYNKISELPVSLTTIARNSSVKIIKTQMQMSYSLMSLELAY